MKRSLTILAASAALALAAMPAGADILYTQGFDSPDVTGGTGNYVDVYGWQGHLGSNGQAANLGGGDNWGTDPVSGAAQQLRVVDDAGAPSPSNRIYSYMNAASDYLIWTDAVAVNLAQATQLDLSWYQRSDASVGFRAAVGIDDGNAVRWFASETVHGGQAAWTQHTVDLLSGNWIEFAFDGTMAADASGAFDVSGVGSALPGGTLQGIGLYVQMDSGDSARFDSVELAGTIVPEPATVSLLVLGGLVALRRRR